jgi:VanZ family protein
MTERLRDRLTLAAWTLAIFVGGSLKLPAAPVEPPPIGWDKLAHALGFFLTQRIAERALRHDTGGAPSSPARVAVTAALVAAFLGGLLEVYQAALPHRSADVVDFVADVVGAGFALLLSLSRQRRRPVE